MKRQGKRKNDAEIQLPPAVQCIMTVLERQGHKCYAVGGCVRDHYLKKQPKDWDLATSMRPEDTARIFRALMGWNVVTTGARFGTVTVMPPYAGEGYEITTFRSDGQYVDGRHPESVSFSGDVLDDLSRRDLTINAMAWSPRTGLVDPFGGRRDIDARTIRTVGSPDRRFSEDALRMMRAVRFSAQLGFDIEPGTRSAIRRGAGAIEMVSQNRRTDEIVKILKSPRPEAIGELEDLGLMKYVLPEVHELFQVRQNHPWHLYDAGRHTMNALAGSPDDLYTRLAILFHDVGKAPTHQVGPDGIDHFPGHPEVSARMTAEIMRRMRFDNDTVKGVSGLVAIHDKAPDATPKSVRRFASRNGLSPDMFQRYHDVVAADGRAQNPTMAAGKLETNDRVLDIYRNQSDEPMTVRSLALNGHDMMGMGLRGPEIGMALNGLLERVLDDPSLNTKDALTEIMRQSQTEAMAL